MNTNNPGKRIGAVVFSVVAIAASAWWIIHYQRGNASAALDQQRGLGQVMAERTVKLLESKEKKRIVVVTLDANDPGTRAQMEAFERGLKQAGGIEILDTVKLDPSENPKYRSGDGLSARRFARLVDKYEDAEGLVSFVGVPDPADEEMKKLESKPPRFIAFTRDLDKLPKLFKDRTLRVAIVPRYEFPAPGPENPKTPQEWFDRHFQIVTSNTLAKIIQ
jgi:hypothetical protein